MATCHPTHWDRPDKGGNSSRLCAAYYRQGAEISYTGVGNQGGPTKDVPRMLIEFCCSEDSKLSTPRKVNENCRCVRVAEKEDGTQPSCRQRLASLVQDFKNEFKDGVLILYASLPCVGGSPWGNVNGLTVEGQERIQEQQR